MRAPRCTVLVLPAASVARTATLTRTDGWCLSRLRSFLSVDLLSLSVTTARWLAARSRWRALSVRTFFSRVPSVTLQRSLQRIATRSRCLRSAFLTPLSATLSVGGVVSVGWPFTVQGETAPSCRRYTGPSNVATYIWPHASCPNDVGYETVMPGTFASPAPVRGVNVHSDALQ